MENDEFVHRVQERAGLAAEDNARRVTEATLETLGEHLYSHRTERRHLASQLPKELREELLRRQSRTHPTLEEFYSRVAARADLGRADAETQAKAVISVLRVAVAEGEIDHLRSVLPREYGALFGEEGGATSAPPAS